MNEAEIMNISEGEFYCKKKVSELGNIIIKTLEEHRRRNQEEIESLLDLVIRYNPKDIIEKGFREMCKNRLNHLMRENGYTPQLNQGGNQE